MAKTSRILLKTSPLIDIDATIRQLTYTGISAVSAVHVVAVQGEVKEVLLVIDGQTDVAVDTTISAVNLLPDRVLTLSFGRDEERGADVVTLGNPLQYLYEPNAAVLKAGAFRLMASRFSLVKLAPNSHLYTSPDYTRTISPAVRS